MPSKPPPLLEFKSSGDVTIVTFTHDDLMDEEVIDYAGRELVELVAGQGCWQLVLNFGAVKRMSTHMLGELIILHKKMQTAGGRMVLCGLNPELIKIFRMTRLTAIFAICNTEEEACQSF
jgi:anti-sigma B factor antagonist